MQPTGIQKNHWLQDNRWLQLTIFGGFLLLVFQLPFWQILDAKYNDFWVRFVAERTKPSDDIVIIEIDDRSLVNMESDVGHWPWPRSQHAFLIERLRAVNAKAIVFDMFFSEKDIFRPEDDSFFNETVSVEKDVFLAASLLSDDENRDRLSLSQLPTHVFHIYPKNTAAIKHSPIVNISLPWIVDPQYWQVGLVHSNLDADHVFRQYPVYEDVEGWVFPSLPLTIYKTLYSNENEIKNITKYIRLKYHGLGKQPYEYISYSDAINNLSLEGENENNRIMFSEKIIIVGATATGLHDLRTTPIDANYAGVAILATALDNLINQDYFLSSIEEYRLLLLLFLGLFLFAIYLFFSDYKEKLLYSGLYVLILGVGGLVLSWWASTNSFLLGIFSIWSILACCYLLLSFYQGLVEFLQRQHAMRTFSRFMDPQVVKQLVADKNWTSTLAHKTSQVSVLFSDIRGFTSLSEKRSAEQVMQILNDYFDLQVNAIFSTQGTLDKFIGDAVMAFWGAPIEDEKHAENAVVTALVMVDNLLEFRKALPEELQNFDVGIGIHSGEAVVGMLGSKRRFDYTAIGDTVNLASRIEGVTKGRARVLVSQVTKDLCEDKFEFTYSGEFSVKGREKKVKLYEPRELNSNGAETLIRK